jgi:predicted transcriptional regulator
MVDTKSPVASTATYCPASLAVRNGVITCKRQGKRKYYYGIIKGKQTPKGTATYCPASLAVRNGVITCKQHGKRKYYYGIIKGKQTPKEVFCILWTDCQ